MAHLPTFIVLPFCIDLLDDILRGRSAGRADSAPCVHSLFAGQKPGGKTREGFNEQRA
jgi:hypothetical protein